jgi:hypothetical protein
MTTAVTEFGSAFGSSEVATKFRSISVPWRLVKTDVRHDVQSAYATVASPRSANRLARSKTRHIATPPKESLAVTLPTALARRRFPPFTIRGMRALLGKRLVDIDVG